MLPKVAHLCHTPLARLKESYTHTHTQEKVETSAWPENHSLSSSLIFAFFHFVLNHQGSLVFLPTLRLWLLDKWCIATEANSSFTQNSFHFVLHSFQLPVPCFPLHCFNKSINDYICLVLYEWILLDRTVHMSVAWPGTDYCQGRCDLLSGWRTHEGEHGGKHCELLWERMYELMIHAFDRVVSNFNS